MHLRHIKQFTVLAFILLLIGAGCPFGGQTTGPGSNASLPDGVVLGGVNPPADCGERNPNKLQAFIAIPNPSIVLGESITIDASCSVGRIALVQWDFDFEGWPEYVPSEQRFQPAIQVATEDLQSRPNSPPTGGWSKNNLPPFHQVHTPRVSGTHTVRLLVTDLRGERQLVLHTYIVRPGNPGQGSIVGAGSYRTNFSTFDHFNSQQAFVADSLHVPDFPVADKIHVPYLKQIGRMSAYAFGSSGDIREYVWTVRRLGNVSSNVAEETDMPPGPQDTSPAIKFQIIDILRDAPQQDTFGALAFVDTFDQAREPEQTIDFSLSLRTTSQLGEEKTIEKMYTLVDGTTVKRVYPQLALLPNAKSAILADGPGSSAWENMPTAYSLQPGQMFELQNYSLYAVSPRFLIPGQVGFQQTIGETTLEFDPGTGIYEEVARVPAITTKFSLPAEVRKFYKDAHVTRSYTAPTQPGIYTARLRVTQAAVPGKINSQQAETSVRYRIPETVPMTADFTASPSSAINGQTVVFDASISTGNIAQYRWRVEEETDTGRIPVAIFASQHDPNNLPQSARFRHSFSLPQDVIGTIFKITLELVEAQTNRLVTKTKLYTVGPKTTVVPHTSTPTTQDSSLRVSVEIYPVDANRQQLPPPIYIADGIKFFARGLSAATMQRLEWDFESDGTIDERCDVVEPYVGAGYSTCINAYTNAPQTAGNKNVRVKVIGKNGGEYTTSVPYAVVTGNRAGLPAARPLPTIVPELHTENKTGTRMLFHPEIYQDDSIVFRLTGITTAVQGVDWDLRNDGIFDIHCVNATIPSGLQCQMYRIVSFRTPPGDYVARARVYAADSNDVLDYTIPYTVIQGSRPADKNS